MLQDGGNHAAVALVVFVGISAQDHNREGKTKVEEVFHTEEALKMHNSLFMLVPWVPCRTLTKI